MSKHISLTLDEVYDLAERVCVSAGYDATHAAAIARTVTRAEADEAKSHGLYRISQYVQAVSKAGATGGGEPLVSSLSPALLRADGQFRTAPIVLETVRPQLVTAARSSGIAAAALVNIFHFAALWPEVEDYCNDGMVALAFTSSLPYVAPAGGGEPLYGTNPMAFGWPRKNERHLIFDQASSVAARGEIELRRREGSAIPEGWAVDAAGDLTTDPQAALDGAQLPFGGYKGASIALMIELLAGALIGERLSFEAAEYAEACGCEIPLGGELIIVLDPARFSTRAYAQSPFDHAERLFDLILSQEGARLPSDRRYAARERTALSGVSVPLWLYDDLCRAVDS